MIVAFPPVFVVNLSIAGNRIRQIGARSMREEGALAQFSSGRLRGFLFRADNRPEEVLILPKSKRIPGGYLRVLQGDVPRTGDLVDLSDAIWQRHPLFAIRDRPETQTEEVLKSWEGAFTYAKEDLSRNIVGLRSPQLGAIHAIHAHWAVGDGPATVVMPTGTGKTDTMISILVSAACSKVLVVVPTDALRTQLTNNFLTLGILGSSPDVLLPGVKYPIVCSLERIPRSTEEVDAVFLRSQVIVTTSSVAGRSSPAVQSRMAHYCPYLFIDEAHHIEAPTWSALKAKFGDSRILQFTATPFREDGRPLGGQIIFNYPLRKAQQEGYFKPIRFEPIVEFNPKRSDKAIAERAVKQLREDYSKGHIVMARVETVARAEEVFELYNQYPEFNPVQLHTGIKSVRQRRDIRNSLIAGTSRIVVCVDMLGEGFDLPELKIAAFHDIRKTLTVTLQLAGRFTRTRPDLGEPTFIANTADVNVQEELRKLYTRDPDWNVLLPQLSDSMVGEQVSLQEFLTGFTHFAEEIPLRTIRPATSAVVYTTTCGDWAADNFRAGIPGISTCEQVHYTINPVQYTLVVVTARRVPLAWTNVQELFSWQWELYIAIWSPSQKLLYINGSANAGEYGSLAKALVGDTTTLISGQQVFRSFAGIARLRLQNVGLTEQLGRNVRYTGRMGSDIGPALSDVQRRRARKSVLSGSGYEAGERTTVGASRKGRIWSHRRDRLDELVTWCKRIGDKLLDESIDPDEVLKGTLEATIILDRPGRMPIGIDWPEELYTDPEQLWSFTIDGREYHLSELSIELVSPAIDGPIRLAIASDDEAVELRLDFFNTEESPNYRFVALGQHSIVIRRGLQVDGQNVVDFFHREPPVIWFADGSSLEGNQYVESKNVPPPFDASKIQAWDWTGTNIRKESQGLNKDSDSLQARVIQDLRSRDYDVIVDDDGKGEAADVVTIRLIGDRAAPSQIEVEFYHCKYSGGSSPGQRIKDLYEVCGQAQKSIWWMYSPGKRIDLFTHLLRRDAQRELSGQASRLEVGSKDLLYTIREMSQLCLVSLQIYIVQPGLSKARVTRDQLELLSVTENHLMETFQLGFGIIASA
jgi:superfamily II DNA or RNA helicase